MADEIDLANALVEGEVERALRQIRQQTSMQQASGVKSCVECGDDIPTERQQFGFKFCVPCASETERRKSLFAEA